ncbi:hypothetical protein ACLSU7_02025 [Bdellovibrio sp. HCB185ZH]|uniref:hypothetical protein n=1 Tax=Bdellovibrio sp. HCB185ZH TaxID=3394235 RepID=UPI0039A76648
MLHIKSSIRQVQLNRIVYAESGRRFLEEEVFSFFTSLQEYPPGELFWSVGF